MEKDYPSDIIIFSQFTCIHTGKYLTKYICIRERTIFCLVRHVHQSTPLTVEPQRISVLLRFYHCLKAVHRYAMLAPKAPLYAHYTSKEVMLVGECVFTHSTVAMH